MYIAIIVKGSEIMKSFMLKFFKKYGGIHTIIISYHINIYKGKAMVRIMVFLGTKKAVLVSALP